MDTFLKFKWVVVSFGLLIVGIVFINSIGDRFISETTQEVSLLGEERSKASSARLNKPAPSFELATINSEQKTLSDYLGSPLIVTFWSSWNPHATDQIKILDDYITGEPSKEFQVVTINSQEDESIVSNFIRRGGYSVTVLIDDTGSVSELYNARNLPATYFLDEDGIIKDIIIGTFDENTLIDNTTRLFSK